MLVGFLLLHLFLLLPPVHVFGNCPQGGVCGQVGFVRIPPPPRAAPPLSPPFQMFGNCPPRGVCGQLGVDVFGNCPQRGVYGQLGVVRIPPAPRAAPPLSPPVEMFGDCPARGVCGQLGFVWLPPPPHLSPLDFFGNCEARGVCGQLRWFIYPLQTGPFRAPKSAFGRNVSAPGFKSDCF